MDTDLLADYVETNEHIKELKADLKLAEQAKKDLEPRALAELERAGVQNIKIAGSTVFVHRQLWARAKDGNKEAAVAALKAAGLSHIVSETFNTQTLSAYVRELDTDSEELDDELAAVLDITEDFSLRCRRG
jgi:hypothetical protein